MKKKKMKQAVPFAVMTTMLLSATLPAFAANGFTFEDWDREIISEKGEQADQEKDSKRLGRTGRSVSRAASASEMEERAEKTSDRDGEEAASPSELVKKRTIFSQDTGIQKSASPAELAMPRTGVSASLGNLWENWEAADLSFLDGTHGWGTKEKPYQIRTRNQLMGLSFLAAFGMQPDHGEVEEAIVGDYRDAWFELTANIDLGGMEWIPIGYYSDDSEFSGDVTHPFRANLDGNGYKISNFRFSGNDWPNVGFFGEIEGGEIRNLILEPGKPVRGSRQVGILAGTARNAVIYNCQVKGDVEGAGKAGGVVGSLEAGTVENVSAQVTVRVTGRAAGAQALAGGIAGEASGGSSLIDCQVRTGDNSTSRIQGTDAAVGGIAGLQNGADIYNAYVNGTIGGTGTQKAGGLVGERVSGDLKVGRFEGTIGQSGTGAAGHRGTFIGYRAPANYFKYGEEVAYLFADTEAKIANNVCGSGISDDNQYTYGAHIGYSHAKDNFFTLVSGGVTRDVEDRYFYEELEQGILSIVDDELGGEMDPEKVGYDLDHFAPNDAGRPIRGYLITIPQIDTVSNGTNYYDVAALEARGSGAYARTLDKTHRGAVAPGKTVTVSTSARQTETAKFQMVDVPTYLSGKKRRNTTYVNGGEYQFTMPEENTQVSAVYKKVAVSVGLTPNVAKFQVVQERTGNRKNPTRTTRVMDGNGKLIATYINGNLQAGTQVQPVTVQAVVDQNNDVADASVCWSVDDSDLITLLPNDDEENGYTKKSASIQVNLNSSFIVDTVRRLEKEQADRGYQYAIGSEIYGAGHQNGGVAVLTAQTKPLASFDGKPCRGNARIEVTFQIKDKTYVANEGAALDQDSLKFEIVRRLTGNRKHPEEVLEVAAPQTLTASFTPDYFDRKDISWTVGDEALISVDGEAESASVRARKDAKWIRDLIAEDQGKHAVTPYEKQTGSGSRNTRVTVIGDDMLGNRQTASCEAEVHFRTVDESKIYVEGLSLSPKTLQYEVKRTRTGASSRPVETWTGTGAKKLAAAVTPAQAFNQKVTYQAGDDSLHVASDGTMTVNTTAQWILELERQSLKKGVHTAYVTVRTEDGGFTDRAAVTIQYESLDQTYRSSSHSGGSSHASGGSGGGSSSGKGSAGKQSAGASGPGQGETAVPSYVVSGNWRQETDGRWSFLADGRTYHSEWAAVYNPYADLSKGQRAFDWFRFDENGRMMTGWYQDADGSVYYLWPVPDGTQGRMLTGWNWIPGEDGKMRCYYFQEESDGMRGRLYRDSLTPDGKRVDADGAWILDGLVQTRMAE